MLRCQFRVAHLKQDWPACLHRCTPGRAAAKRHLSGGNTEEAESHLNGLNVSDFRAVQSSSLKFQHQNGLRLQTFIHQHLKPVPATIWEWTPLLKPSQSSDNRNTCYCFFVFIPQLCLPHTFLLVFFSFFLKSPFLSPFPSFLFFAEEEGGWWGGGFFLSWGGGNYSRHTLNPKQLYGKRALFVAICAMCVCRMVKGLFKGVSTQVHEKRAKMRGNWWNFTSQHI